MNHARHGTGQCVDTNMTRVRWRRLMTAIGAAAGDDVFDALLAAYSESHRHYHDVSHVSDCLAQLDEVVDLAAVPEEVELALWFHDAIYRPTSSSNESDSAEWAARALSALGIAPCACDRIHRHIMATKHDATAPGGDSALVVDIDLSILGRAPEVYAVFERNVRAEYRWVPKPLYARRRSEILASFLERDAIYVNARIRERYEAAARANLRAAIAALRS